jgi:hypothetical protein
MNRKVVICFLSFQICGSGRNFVGAAEDDQVIEDMAAAFRLSGFPAVRGNRTDSTPHYLTHLVTPSMSVSKTLLHFTSVSFRSGFRNGHSARDAMNFHVTEC